MQTLLFCIKIILIQLILFHLQITVNTTTNITGLEYLHWTKAKFKEKWQLFNYACFHNSCKQEKMISLYRKDCHGAVAFHHPNIKATGSILHFFMQLHRKTNLRLLTTVSAFGFLKRVIYLLPKYLWLGVITSLPLVLLQNLQTYKYYKHARPGFVT